MVNYCSGPYALDQNSNNITIGPSLDSPSSLLFFVYLFVFSFFFFSFFFAVFVKWELGFW